MDAPTLADLRRRCRALGIATSGTRAEVLARLSAAGPSAPSASAVAPASDHAATSLDALAVPQLQQLCRARQLAVNGTKSELVARLRGAELHKAGLRELKECCRAAGLSVVGTRAELAARLTAPATGLPATTTAQGNKKETKETTTAVVAPVERPVEREERPVEREKRNVNPRPDLKDTYEKLTVPELKELCAKHKLHVSGPKEKLVARLRLSVLTIAELSGIARKIGVHVGGKRAQHIDKLSVEGVRAKALAELRHVPPRPKVVRQKRKAPTEEEIAEENALEAKRREAAKRFKQSLYTAAPIQTKDQWMFPRPIVPSSATASSATCVIVYTVEGSSRAAGSPSYGFSRVFSSKDGANAHVRRIFYDEHPGGWSPRQFEEHAGDVSERYDNGQLTISLGAPHKLWAASSICVPASSQLIPKMRECYLVYSHQKYFFSAPPQCSPRLKLHSLVSDKGDASALVEQIFYHENPWGLSKAELQNGENRPSRHTSEGVVSLSRTAGSGEDWSVDTFFLNGGEVPASEEWFIVYTKNICHVTGDAYYQFSRLLKTRQESNDLVKQVFYKHNPWGWSSQDFHSRPVKSKCEDGLVEISLRFEGEWMVRALEVPVGSQVPASRPDAAILVLSTKGYSPDDLRPKEKSTLRIQSVVSSVGQANSTVEEIFYIRNPYAWRRREFHEDTPYYYDAPKIKTQHHGGLTSMSINPRGKEPWKVFALPFSSDTTLDDGSVWTTLSTGSNAPIAKPSHVAVLAAQRAEEAKKPKEIRTKDQPWFLVYSFYEKFPYEGPTYEFFPLFTSAQEANGHVEHVFYKQNPWGWKQEDFDRSGGGFHSNMRAKTTRHDGLLKISMKDEEEWTVRVIPVPPGSEIPVDDPTAAVVIHTAFGYRPDGFHAPMRQKLKIETVMPSKETANARVKEIFFKNHSYEWSIKQLTSGEYGSGADIEKEYERGLLTMSIHPDSDESWSVYAQAVKKPTSEFRAMGDYYIPSGDERLSDDDSDLDSGYSRAERAL